MGTRSGALDPGVIIYLARERGLSIAEIEALLYRQSGLLGVSGVSNDVRVLLESSDPNAALALDFFVYRVSRELGSLAAALGGLDALVFTAGIGENNPELRARIVRRAAWLGLDLDQEANAAGAALISSPASRVAVWVIPTNEELMIAEHALALLR
jgi:acetate kinase